MDDQTTLALSNLFAAEPSAELWKQLKPLDLDQLTEWWRLVEDDNTPLINTQTTEYREELKSWGLMTGLYRKALIPIPGLAPTYIYIQFGPFRDVTNDGLLYEYTMKEGRNHGIERTIEPDKVTYRLFKQSKKLAELKLNDLLMEVSRTDPDGYFADLTEETLLI